jgi:1,2-phenylacetyl-CoA epoxidase PaaB subunit
LTKDDLRDPNKLMDVLTIFALEQDQLVQATHTMYNILNDEGTFESEDDESVGSGSPVTKAKTNATSPQPPATASSSSSSPPPAATVDPYVWAQTMTALLVSSGMHTAEHLLLAIRKGRMLDLILPSTSTSTSTSSSTNKVLASAVSVTNKSALNQFLSRIDSSLYKPEGLLDVLREFMLLKQSTNLQSHRRSSSAGAAAPYPQHSALPLSSPNSGGGGGAGGSGIMNNNQNQNLNQLAQEREQAYHELWIRCTEVSKELVVWWRPAGITTGAQLRNLIRRGTLSSTLRSANVPTRLIPDTWSQYEMIQFLAPLPTQTEEEVAFLEQVLQQERRHEAAMAAASAVASAKAASSVMTNTPPPILKSLQRLRHLSSDRQQSLLGSSTTMRRTMSGARSMSTAITATTATTSGGGRSSMGTKTRMSDPERLEYNRLLGMANPEQSHLILHELRHSSGVLQEDKDEGAATTVTTGGAAITTTTSLLSPQAPPPLVVPQRDYYIYEERQRFKARPLATRLFVTVGLPTCFSSCLSPDATADETEEGSSVVQGWLRTRFADRADHDEYIKLYCQYFMEAHCNQTGAVVATISSLLLRYFELTDDEYRSEVCTLASALSNTAQQTHFGIHPTVRASMNHRRATSTSYSTTSAGGEDDGYFDDDILRLRFVDFMGILFQAIEKHRFLIENSNTYRLAHCLTDGSFDKTPLWVPTFSVLLQAILILYVCLELYSLESYTLSYQMVTLGILTSIYGAIQARNGLHTALSVMNVYQKNEQHLRKKGNNEHKKRFPGTLALVDMVANIGIPVVVIFAGFLIVALQESYIDGVLNSAALLFIPEIDDELPSYFNWNAKEIVEAYLVRKTADTVVSKMNFHARVSRKQRVNYLRAGVMRQSSGEDIDFHDIVITNTKTSLEADKDEGHCSPHEVRASVDTYAIVRDHGQWFVHHELQPEKVYVTSSITSDCLFKEIKWRYVRDNRLNKGYVDRLFLKKLDGTEVLLHQDDSASKETIFDGADDDDEEARRQPGTVETAAANNGSSNSNNVNTNANGDYFREDWDGEVRGIFIITNFDRDQLVTSLRICGSVSPDDDDGDLSAARESFQRAVEYYSLWDLTDSAKSVLDGSLVRKTTSQSLSRMNQVAYYLWANKFLDDYDKFRWGLLAKDYVAVQQRYR